MSTEQSGTAKVARERFDDAVAYKTERWYVYWQRHPYAVRLAAMTAGIGLVLGLAIGVGIGNGQTDDAVSAATAKLTAEHEAAAIGKSVPIDTVDSQPQPDRTFVPDSSVDLCQNYPGEQIVIPKGDTVISSYLFERECLTAERYDAWNMQKVIAAERTITPLSESLDEGAPPETVMIGLMNDVCARAAGSPDPVYWDKADRLYERIVGGYRQALVNDWPDDLIGAAMMSCAYPTPEQIKGIVLD